MQGQINITLFAYTYVIQTEVKKLWDDLMKLNQRVPFAKVVKWFLEA